MHEVSLASVLFSDPLLLPRFSQLCVPLTDRQWSICCHVGRGSRNHYQKALHCAVQEAAAFVSSEESGGHRGSSDYIGSGLIIRFLSVALLLSIYS
jgi:hypothetical protein